MLCGPFVRPPAGPAEDLRSIGRHLVIPRVATRRHTVHLSARWPSAELGLEVDPVC